MGATLAIKRWRLDENLERLRRQLEGYVLRCPKLRRRSAAPHSACARLAERLPLMHSCPKRAFMRALNDGALFSRAELYRRGVDPMRQCAEVDLETEDFAFTYVGVFALPQFPCGFAFSPRCEEREDMVVATPFDSGGLVKHFRPQNSPFRRLRLPARSYVRRFLETLFADPWDYMDGKGPDCPGPVPIQGDDPRSYTWEVRFQNRIPFFSFPNPASPDASGGPGPPHTWLQAVILPVSVTHNLLRRGPAWETVRRWEDRGVSVEPYDAETRRLREVGEEFVREFVTQEV